MTEIQTRNVFTRMRPDLQLVEARIEAVSRVDFPFVSSLLLDLVRAGGKRLRPLVLLLAGHAYDPDPDRLITAAAGVELLHTASLVHDDTIDRAALRRGQPTLNSRLGSGAVILLGDFLFAQSAMLAAATGMPRVVSIFASTLAEICDGQLREVFQAHRLDQSRADYEQRIYGKTAALFAGSAEMGAIVGGAPDPDIAALRSYGSDIGMAFQIVDDVLDLRESTDDLGKTAGNDIRQGTVTLPIMLYAASLTPNSHEAVVLEAVVSGELTGDEDVNRVIAGLRASNAIEESMAVAASFAERAIESIAIVPDAETRAMLTEVARLAWDRQV